MVFDRFVFPINNIVFEQFLAVATPELAPTNFSSLRISQQFLARTQICHPDVIPRRWQSTAAETCH